MIDRNKTFDLMREAGLQPYYDAQAPAIERFAALIEQQCNIDRPPPHRVLLERARQEEREACAKLCDESAIRLFSGKSRVNQVDRHTAEVLRRHAAAIRARKSND